MKFWNLKILNRKNIMSRMRVILLMVVGVVFFQGGEVRGDDRPNILWILAEDICPDLSCYGVKGVKTPHLDMLAGEGIRYERAFSTSPVCSTSRSAMMVGVHQQTVDAHQHRTQGKKMLAKPYKPFVHLLEEAGYFTCLMDRKTDLNFKLDKKLMMGKDWKGRKEGQPFFAQLTFTNTHRGWRGDPVNPVDPGEVELPPYYPDTPLLRKDWAMGLGDIQVMDRRVGKVLKRLEDEGLADNTVVIFIGDHGRCHVRGKQFLYDGGLRIPMILKWPGTVKGGQVSEDLVMTLDVTKTVLGIAGAEVPDYLQGEDLFEGDTKGRKYLFASRGKMDDTHDAMRSVRSKDFKYILNLMPERAWMQYNWYKTAMYPGVAVMNAMHLRGELNKDQAKFMQKTKPREELYDLRMDPHELNNLAEDVEFAGVLREMRDEMVKFRGQVNDRGVNDGFRKGGWSGEYPYKTLAEWEGIVKQWEAKILHGKKIRIDIGRRVGLNGKQKKARRGKKAE